MQLPSLIAANDLPPELIRTRFFSRGGRFFGPIPDALMAAILALAALSSVVPMPYFAQSQLDLLFALVVEGGFLLMQGTLVDIATRLRKRPPLWLIPLILAGLLLVSSGALDVLKMAWDRGAVVFIPLLVSLGERGTMLWNMPIRTRIEKIAARALIANRITTGLALVGLTTIAMIAGVVFQLYDWNAIGSWPPFAAGAIYFAVAAYDDWRVRGPRFAGRPRVLFRFDPIHIDYLAPLAVVLLFAAPLQAQDSDARVVWLADHAARLRSIEPAGGDFRDLEPLRGALDGARGVRRYARTISGDHARHASAQPVQRLHARPSGARGRPRRREGARRRGDADRVRRGAAQTAGPRPRADRAHRRPLRLTEVYNRAVAAANAFQHERALALLERILREARDESLRADTEDLKRRLTLR
jgi:hypothetical protein